MRSSIAIHLAVTFETPGGSVPPDREGDGSDSTRNNSMPPVQRTDPVVIDVPPGTRPRVDLFVTIATDPEGAGKVEPRKGDAPGTGTPAGGSREEGSPAVGSEGGR
jgi:hypothetical protein